MSSSSSSPQTAAALVAQNRQREELYQKVQFLLRIAQRFEEDGNLAESIKSTETALLLRRNNERNDPELSSLFPLPLLKEAQELVLKCNSVAVEQFQSGHYDTASFLLNKALFLTEELEETSLFGDAEHDRLRLRAATFNNLGCLEKRRGRMHVSLDHLQKAAQLEVSVDPDVGASPSTHLNLCTVLNKLGNHVAAASAAQRAINTLKFQSQQGADQYPNFAVMLAVAYYNLGASLEQCERPGDAAQALEAYSNCLDASRRYQLDPQHATVLQATDALRRLQGNQPNAMVLPTVPRAGGPQRMFSTAGAPAVGPGGELVPTPPTTKKDTDAMLTVSNFRVPQVGRSNSSSGLRPNPNSKLGDAALRHAERIQARQRKKEANAERDQVALMRAQRAHVKEKEEKQRREREAESARREEMAKTLYEKMVQGLRAEEIKRVKNAARKIQKVWRGYLARTFVKTMHRSAAKIQAVVRSWLCRLHISRTEAEKQERAAKEAQLKRQMHACITVQRFIRQALRRLDIIRQYRAKKLRQRCSAKRIQQCFRRHCQRREHRIQMQLEAERTADERRLHRQHEAARKIQAMFRSFKMRRITRIVALEQKRRADAATRIQALVRGVLTRIWFRHYRLYRRQQELSSTKNLRLIIRMQSVWRRALAIREVKRRRVEKRYQDRMTLLHRAALKIQCVWRCHCAKLAAEPLRKRRQMRVAAVEKIQRRYLTYKARTAYLQKRDALRKQYAARQIQVWFRERVIINKHMDVARYHANIQRQKRIALLRTQAAVLLQAFLQHRMSSLIVESTRNTFLKQSRIALVIQKVCRGYTVREDMRVLRGCAAEVDEERRVALHRRKAACIIQRATRCYLAKQRVHLMRIQRAASLMISKTYRMHRAQLELRRLRQVKRQALEERSAKVIQRLARKFVKKLELKRLDEYYSEKNRQKLAMMRKEEAAVTIQAIWRGHATRRETTSERNRLLQNTIDAIRIQRQFRAWRFRTRINDEIRKRQANKKLRRVASVRIQSFWRAVLAREYVHVLREQRYNLTVCAIAIQCAWRRYRARRELDVRRANRVAKNVLRAKQHDIWEDAINAVATELRCRASKLLRLQKLRKSLIAQITERERETFMTRHGAATKIQAIYRGHYERAYARYLRREKWEADRKAAELLAKRNRAALKIQLAWKCSEARAEANRRRLAKSEAALADQIQRETVADPHDLVKRLFWSHEAVVRRDLTRERVDRHNKANAAAVAIQRNVRRMIAVQRFKLHLKNKEESEAARRIQAQWKDHEAETKRQREQLRFSAAVRIQAMVRGALVRTHWAERQRRLSYRRGSAVYIEDTRDMASIRIQSAWRMYSAKCKADRLREEREVERIAQLQHESARLIQKQFRGHLARRRVAAMRSAVKPSDTATTAPPPPPRFTPKPPTPPSAALQGPKDSAGSGGAAVRHR